jgi:hypothetical protein
MYQIEPGKYLEDIDVEIDDPEYDEEDSEHKDTQNESVNFYTFYYK